MAGRCEGLSDLAWQLFADLFPAPLKRGRGMPPTPWRQVVHTLRNGVITGCRWCDLPGGVQGASKSAAHRWLKRHFGRVPRAGPRRADFFGCGFSTLRPR